MSYYKLLGLEREPFSTSPDPFFLYMTREHDLALTNILIELRLRRGLSVILGDIGTGKTSLSRKLVRELNERNDFIFHVILNPSFENEKEFLYSLLKNFQIPFPEQLTHASAPEMRDAFEKFLLEKNLRENKTVIVIIDEAQTLSLDTLESLRILLNYETNEYKLIQIVLLGQLELFSKMTVLPNFYDRICFKFTLNPLGLQETKELILFRLRQAGYNSREPLFSEEAMSEVYYFSKGYPRSVIRICHKCLRALVMSKDKTIVDQQLAVEVIGKDSDSQWQKTTTLPLKESF